MGFWVVCLVSCSSLSDSFINLAEFFFWNNELIKIRKVALARNKPLIEASAWGSVAASFCIEQVGVPILSADADGRETWNGESVSARLQEYMGRLERPGLLDKMNSGFGEMDLK